MSNSEFSDRDVERLLRGDEVSHLSDVAPALAAMRALDVAPTQDETDRMGVLLAAAAAEGTPVAAPAPARRFGWRARAAVVGGLALLFAGAASAAASADEAAPGDALYALDRALEGLGILDGGLEERIQEALKLDAEGAVEEALEHVAEALAGLDALDETVAEESEPADEATDESPDDASETDGDESEATVVAEDEAEEPATRESACDALRAAAATIRDNGSGGSAEVHARVSEMLTWMAATDAKGRDFGHEVSKRARGLHPKDDVENAPAEDAHDAVVAEQGDGATDDEEVTKDGAARSEDKVAAPEGSGSEDKQAGSTTDKGKTGDKAPSSKSGATGDRDGAGGTHSGKAEKDAGSRGQPDAERGDRDAGDRNAGGRDAGGGAGHGESGRSGNR